MKIRPAIPVFLKGFFIGVIGLSAFYYFFLYIITLDPSHPLLQFSKFQPWMSLLILGFGIQMGLFGLLRKGYRFSLSEKNDARFAAGTGTAASGLAMAACCAHHLVDVLPILGVSAAAIFLADYQQELLIFGVITNAAGIAMMAWMLAGKPTLKEIARHSLKGKAVDV